MRIFGKRLAMLGLSLALNAGCILYACRRTFYVDQRWELYTANREAGEVYHWMGGMSLPAL